MYTDHVCRVDPNRLEVEAFVEAVESGSSPPIGREETVANMRVLYAICESAAEGRPITL